MSNSSKLDLGPWRYADLSSTVARYTGDGTDDDLDPIMRFGRSVCRLALRRQRQSRRPLRTDAIAIFLHRPSVPAGISTFREPMLGDGGVEVCGKIWFANATVQSGRAMTVASEEDGDMFDRVEGLGLGRVPAVVFNPKVKTPTVRIYGRGVSQDETVEPIEIADVEIDSKTIRATIDWVAKTQLATPEMQVTMASMWAKAAKSWVSNNAEAIAQLHLKTALAVRFFHCEVRQEQRGRVGRTDLEVAQQRGDGMMVFPAEIEIKVLRERTSSGRRCADVRTERWMRRGVRQAAAYRDDRAARCGILCCFDMRSIDRGERTALLPIQEYAERMNVILHRNFLYNSSDAWRKVHYPT